ncbi:UvrD-helicase domain-containing protein [Wenzhouxiangella sp. AB-CW3]|uniref:UvrD-helicase domain-containing protein n=1 Tax=Wenzhouxiangella sp. AB-CW3 TaxID=2771012 RepID=UPI00168BEFF4|nr:UvrD-helicase domain-containing protein [Wenzhouxiangella sp. AB-CW3]QOC22074.1 UvrD-helicase domain-containing protein [Wenzhouxiangella sp. AB-CW3]
MSDLEQRQRAVDPSRSVIVQAPAGSGKTTLLVERYLGLLAVVDAPEEILAITFTRKAAAEMRARILKYLDPDFHSDKPHEQAALAKARAVQDRVTDWGLRENPQRMLIRTIDSFNHYLARTMPVASQLGPVPAPVEYNQKLYREAARRVLGAVDANDPIADDLEQLLRWRDHRTQDIENLLVGLLGSRDQWLRALGIHGTPDRQALEDILHQRVVSGLDQAAAALNDALTKACISAENILRLLRFAADTLHGEGRSSPIVACSDITALPGADPADLPYWRGLARMLLTKEGKFLKQITIKQGFPPKTPEKEQLSDVLAAIGDDENLADLIHQAAHMPEPRYRDDEWNTLAALIRVLERSAAELELVFAAAGQSDFTGLSRAALRGLGDEDSGYTDLALYLDRRIQHILVDEYQDTNWSQFELLTRLVGGWQADEARSLFLVGDPMQSIYRFREAEVGLFIRTREAGIGDQSVEDCRLASNFRSRAEIVDWVNRKLGPVFPATEDISAGAVAYAPSEPGLGSGGQVELLARPDRASEAEAVAETIATALAENQHRPDYKAAIIVRARSHLADILPALARHNIPYRAVKLDPLQTRPVVQDLLALTRAIVHPTDRAAVYSVLRSPLCGATLADLTTLATNGQHPLDADALDGLTGESRARVLRVAEALENAQDHWRRRPLRELVEGCWHRLGGPQCSSDPEAALRDAGAYLDALATAEQEGLLDDWNDFEELLDGLSTEGDPPSESVQLEILTMHGAKGLEWDLVVLPGLGHGTRGQDRSLLNWLPFTPDDGSEQVLLAPLRSANEATDPPLNELIRREQKLRDRFEHQRLLYVAATRAREHLVLSTVLDPEPKKQKPASDSLLADLWPTLGQEFINALNEAPEPDTTGSNNGRPDQSLKHPPAGWAPATTPALAFTPRLPPRETDIEIEFNWAGVQARRTGTVLHRLLEQVGRIGIESFTDQQRQRLLDRIPALLQTMGTSHDEVEDLAAVVRKAFEQTLDSDSGRWILSETHDDAGCELAVSGMIDGQLVNAIVDRTFVDDKGVRWIIDYKSGFHEGGNLEHFLTEEAKRYRDQLDLYRRLFEAMEDRPVRTALYLPRHQALQEV